MAPFVADALGQVLRRPDQFYELYVESIAADAAQSLDEGALPCSLFALCTLRQAIRILLSEKKSGAEKADVAAYVAAACAKIALMQEGAAAAAVAAAYVGILRCEAARLAPSHGDGAPSSAPASSRKRQVEEQTVFGSICDVEEFLSAQGEPAKPLAALVPWLASVSKGQGHGQSNGTHAATEPKRRKKSKSGPEQENERAAAGLPELSCILQAASSQSTDEHSLPAALDLALECPEVMTLAAENEGFISWLQCATANLKAAGPGRCSIVVRQALSLLPRSPATRCALLQSAVKAAFQKSEGDGLRCLQLCCSSEMVWRMLSEGGPEGSTAVLAMVQWAVERALEHSSPSGADSASTACSVLVGRVLAALGQAMAAPEAVQPWLPAALAAALPALSAEAAESAQHTVSAALEKISARDWKNLEVLWVEAVFAAAAALLQRLPALGKDPSELFEAACGALVTCCATPEMALSCSRLDDLLHAVLPPTSTRQTVVMLLGGAADSVLQLCCKHQSAVRSAAAAALLSTSPSAREAFPQLCHGVLEAASALTDRAQKRCALAFLLPMASAFLEAPLTAAESPKAKRAVSQALLQPLLGFLSAKPHSSKDRATTTGGQQQEAAAKLLSEYSIPCLENVLSHAEALNDWPPKLAPSGWSVSSATEDAYSLAPSTACKARALGAMLKHIGPVGSSAERLLPAVKTFFATLEAAFQLQNACDVKKVTEFELLKQFDGAMGDAIAGLTSDQRNTPAFAELAKVVAEGFGAAVLRHRSADPASWRVLRRLMAALLPAPPSELANAGTADEEIEADGDEGIPMEEGPSDKTASASDSGTTGSDSSSGSDAVSDSDTGTGDKTSRDNLAARARAQHASSGEAGEDALQVMNPSVAVASVHLFQKIIASPMFLPAMRCADASPAPLPSVAAALPRPLQSLLPVAELESNPDPSAEVALVAPAPAGTSNVGTISDVHVKREVCLLLETILDLAEEFMGEESHFTHSMLLKELAAAEEALLPLTMAAYGGSLSAVDMAVWGLARALNARAWRRGKKEQGSDSELEEAGESEVEGLQALLEGPLTRTW